MVRSIAGFQRVSIRHLRLVTTIAEVGSMVRAGEAVGMTQPAVSLPVRLDGILWPVGVSTRKLVPLSPAAEALLAMLRTAGRDSAGA